MNAEAQIVFGSPLRQFVWPKLSLIHWLCVGSQWQKVHQLKLMLFLMVQHLLGQYSFTLRIAVCVEVQL
uniref:Uncharacterized protein n=1 Tax=Rhizophora mucronata TaxID=61149 RepID=A0A2P2QL63_RHIMU